MRAARRSSPGDPAAQQPGRMVSVSRSSSSNFVSAGAGMMSEGMISQTYIRLIVG
jgi:hypothetical protein